MAKHPVYVTEGDGSQGFVELVGYIISIRWCSEMAFRLTEGFFRTVLFQL